MKRARVYGGRKIVLEEGSVPQPSDGEVLIRVEACGICGSDLHVYHAPREYIAKPWIAGHEAAGVIEELGAGVTHFAVGDRVGIEPTIPEADSPMTKIGRYEISDLTHIGGPDWDGGFAEFMTAPVTNIHPLPDNISFSDGAMAEVYATSFHALNLFPVKPGETALIIGSGPIGLTTAEAAWLSGADPLVIVGKPDIQLAVAANALGAITINADSDDLADQVRDATGGRGADVVYEAVGGVAPTFQQCVDFAALLGRVCIIGGYVKPVDLDTGPARMKELMIGWSFCYGRRGHRKIYDVVLDLMENEKINPSPWVTHRFPLTEIERAFETAEDRSSGSIKVIVEPAEGM